jgi:3-phenylpropionate/trans-cinnamate dioxygenase ferredoxin subunit
MTEYISISRLEDLPPGSSKLVEYGIYRIAVFNLDGDIYALEDMCTHDGGPLATGRIVEGCQVECPRHGARFDIKTGNAMCMPAFMPTPTYEIKIEGDEILIAAPE